MKIILAIIALIFVGCAHKVAKFNEIAVGDSRDKVIAVLGNPRDRTINGTVEVLEYNADNGGMLWANYAVILENGKVRSVGNGKNLADKPELTIRHAQ